MRGLRIVALYLRRAWHVKQENTEGEYDSRERRERPVLTTHIEVRGPSDTAAMLESHELHLPQTSSVIRNGRSAK
jgi:hypothetical protein